MTKSGNFSIWLYGVLVRFAKGKERVPAFVRLPLHIQTSHLSRSFPLYFPRTVQQLAEVGIDVKRAECNLDGNKTDEILSREVCLY